MHRQILCLLIRAAALERPGSWRNVLKDSYEGKAQKSIVAFSAPHSIADLIEQQYQVRQIGICNEVIEQFYVISAERKIRHPAVLAIQQAIQCF